MMVEESTVAGIALARRPRLKPAYAEAFAGAYLAAFGVWQLTGRHGTATTRWISDLAALPAFVGAVGTALWAAGRARSSRLRRAWLLTAAAFVLYLGGDALWFVYDVVLEQSPYPSFADVFYLAFYSLIVAALVAFPVAERSNRERATLVFDFGTVFVGALMAVWYLVIGPTALDSRADRLEVALSLAYPVADLVVLFGLLTVLARGIAETPRRAVACLAAGVTCFLVADLAFSFLSLHDRYRPGDWPDTLWVAAPLFVFVAAWPDRRAPERVDPLEHSDLITRFNVLPYLMIVFVWGMVMFAARHQPLFPLLGLLIGGFVLTVLVFARQITAQREVEHLMLEYHEIANCDSLTGLATRRRFFEYGALLAESAQRRGEPVSVIMVDVNGLKPINDTFGHHAGDDALSAAAKAIVRYVEPSALVGRLGGDEFAALIVGASETRVAAMTASLNGLAIPITTHDGEVIVRVTAGCATGTESLDGLLSRADSALYAVRAVRNDHVEVVRPVSVREREERPRGLAVVPDPLGDDAPMTGRGRP
jgi:diguanylate cyclase (GGDEF)-like protein